MVIMAYAIWVNRAADYRRVMTPDGREGDVETFQTAEQASQRLQEYGHINTTDARVRFSAYVVCAPRVR